MSLERLDLLARLGVPDLDLAFPEFFFLVPFAGAGGNLVAGQEHGRLDVLGAALESLDVLAGVGIPQLDGAVAAGGQKLLAVLAVQEDVDPVGMALELLEGDAALFLG